jgi:hypothetical protein
MLFYFLDNFIDFKMDNQQSTKMPKPFDNDQEFNASAIPNNQQQFQLREDDRLKQEDDYRQGKIDDKIFSFFAIQFIFF